MCSWWWWCLLHYARAVVCVFDTGLMLAVKEMPARDCGTHKYIYIIYIYIYIYASNASIIIIIYIYIYICIKRQIIIRGNNNKPASFLVRVFFRNTPSSTPCTGCRACVNKSATCQEGNPNIRPHNATAFGRIDHTKSP